MGPLESRRVADIYGKIEERRGFHRIRRPMPVADDIRHNFESPDWFFIYGSRPCADELREEVGIRRPLEIRGGMVRGWTVQLRAGRMDIVPAPGHYTVGYAIRLEMGEERTRLLHWYGVGYGVERVVIQWADSVVSNDCIGYMIRYLQEERSASGRSRRGA